jgi:rhamnose transport system ATP-binding protein
VSYHPSGVASPLLEAISITKSFAGVRALQQVSFDLQAGEVHALVGENGAGKSTLIRIVTGAETPDGGSLLVSGEPVRRMDPVTSRALGIAAIYQQPSLFPHLTVAENIALALERGRPWRRVRWPARKHRAARLLERIGTAVDPDRLVGSLSMPEQQIVEIAKAIGADARVLIMDEPTASLTDREVERLFRVIARLREEGAGVIYISHRLEEVFAVADRITVLRDGEAIATRRTDAIDRGELIRLMVGRELSAVFPKRTVARGDVVLELRDISNRASGLRAISLSVRSGEILGIAGLVGSGRTELAETMFGLRSVDSGELLVRNTRVRVVSPADAIRLGLAYVPEDRRQHGVVLEMSVAANVSLANLRAVARGGLIDRAVERAAAERVVRQLRIRTPSVAAQTGSLSGGNQQKVALARWLSIDPAALILDEPTQGVDVGAKSEIHEIMEQLAERGAAIVMISSELPEILGMSDRIAVMRAGTIVGTLERAEATQPRILAMALGHDPPAGPTHRC